MTFQPNFPQNSTKLRDAPTGFQANWDAIYKGDSSFKMQVANFDDRTVLALADPTALANAYRLFCKTATVAELYGRDPSNAVMQITSNGRLGGPATNLVINNITFGSDTFSYGLGSIVKARGSVNSAGVLQPGSLNIASVSTGGTGIRNVNISADVLTPASNYQFIAIPTSTSNGNSRTVTISSKGTPVAAVNTQVIVRVHQADGTTLINEAFDFIVIGGV